MDVVSDDLLLIEKVREGDEQSYEYLFNRYFEGLSLLSYRIVRNRVVAEEIVQEFFVKCWMKKESLWISTSFKAYAYRSVYNLSLNYIRDNKRFTSLDDVRAIPVEDNEVQEGSEENQKLKLAIDSLPPQCKKIFMLVCVDGFSYAEVAEELNLSVNTVKTQMSKAYRLLRANFSMQTIICVVVAALV